MLQECLLIFCVTQVSAEYLDRQMTILVTMVMVLPSNTTVVNHLWQDGPLKRDRLGMHAMSGDHLKSMSTLDLLS